MRYLYYICDVFTESPFSGNALAVFPDAQGLSDRQMQQIAREFNFSETTFVLPPVSGHTCRVRIFTPTAELPFAGHPNVGTAAVLTLAGRFGDNTSLTVTFEEAAGPVPVSIRRAQGRPIWCELAAPKPLSLGPAPPLELIARAVKLTPDDILSTRHPPRVASVGLPFVMAEVTGLDALGRADASRDGALALKAAGLPPEVHLYTHTPNAGADLRARMFAPLDGVPEDPATGSANCALAGLLAAVDPATDGSFQWRIAQGVEMGRPSLLEAGAEKRDGQVTTTRVGGASVVVSEGFLAIE
jgi:trans-2,3-dihydro-3-hydroxyanthranilate isomerase